MKTKLSEEQKPTRMHNVLVANEEDAMMLLQEGSEQAFVLNQTSQLIWQLSDGETSIAEMISLLENAFGADDADIQSDVIETITNLNSAGLLSIN